jgi:hypothetical protein
MLIVFPQDMHFPVGISMITFLRMCALNGLQPAPTGLPGYHDWEKKNREPAQVDENAN